MRSSVCARAIRTTRGQGALWALVCVLAGTVACGGATDELVISTRASVEPVRGANPRARLQVQENLEIADLARLRLDSGPVLLVRGVHAKVDVDDVLHLEVGDGGAAFLEVLQGQALELQVGEHRLSVLDASLSLENGAVYVVRGELSHRHGEARQRVQAGERLDLGTDEVTPQRLWHDWTGGLAQPGPGLYEDAAIGTLEARVPDQTGQARWPLVMRRLDVKATVTEDLAVTNVDQVFFNPASEAVEGYYRIRVPVGAVLQRFAVDRDGRLVDGYVREKAQAQQAYQAQVYRGSTLDPALLEWVAPGEYRARIYPIAPGAARRISIRYTEWLKRDSADGPRRYRFPMAGGPDAPIIQELSFEADLTAAHAGQVRAGRAATIEGDIVRMRESDFRPRVDLELELFDADDRAPELPIWRADHVAPVRDPRAGQMPDEAELDYLYIPVVLPDALFESATTEGLDVVVVTDVSAGTERSQLELGRSVAESLATHLGADDRVAILASDVGLRALAGDGALGPATPERLEGLLDALAREPAGGATDLGGALSEAAALLDGSRNGIVVYVGDGAPTVGELRAEELLERVARLPRPLRAYAVGIGEDAHLDLLDAVTRGGGLAIRVETRTAAAEAALRVLGHARRPAAQRVTVTVDGAEQVFPRTPVDVVRGAVLSVVGRVEGDLPATITVNGLIGDQPFEQEIAVRQAGIDDNGDLRLRWAAERLRQLLLSGGQREEIADLGVRYGLITPYTSFYVPSAAEMASLGEAARPLYRDQRGRGHGVTAVGLMPSLAALGLAGCGRGEPDASSVSGPMEAMEEPSMDEMENNDEGGAMGAASASKTLNRYAIEGAGADMVPSSRSAVQPSEPSPAPPAVAPQAEPEPEVAMAREAARGSGVLGVVGGGGGQPGQVGANQQGQRLNNDPLSGLDFGDAEEEAPEELRAEVTETERSGELADAFAANVDTTTVPTDGNGYGRGETGASVDPWGAEEQTVEGPRRMRRARPRTTTGIARIDGGRGNRGGDADQPDNDESGNVDVTVRAGGHRIDVHVGSTPTARHTVSRCSDASDQMLDQRRDLWRERLQSASGISGYVSVFRDARRQCELPQWRDRVALLGLMLSRAGSIAQQVQLWRYLDDGGARRWVRAAILRRVRTPEDLRLARATFGAAAYDMDLVTQVLERAGDGAGRVRALRQLVRQMPSNLDLQLLLLEILERSGRTAEAKRLARELREDPMTDGGIRTAIGEMYLRLEDEAEARRVFGEIVEFAPTDALARRRLGDLFRAHGWFEDAYVQYRTLAAITPDDLTVSLLLAQAAAGAGRVDEALRLEQSLASSADPGAAGGLGRIAMLWSSVRFAELRKAARAENDTERIEALDSRMRRSGVTRNAGAFRATLVWSHPEAGVSLWAAHPGLGLTRPTELAPEYGLEAFDLSEQEAAAYQFEVRRADRFARPGSTTHAAGARPLTQVHAKLVFVWNEGQDDEQIEIRELTFDGTQTKFAYRVEGRTLSEVTQ